MRYLTLSLYLRQRFRQVVLHYIWKSIFEENCLSTEIASMSWYVMRWSFFLEIWHESTAQLLADGVPRERVLVGGVFDVLRIWDRHKKTTVNWKSLPKWTYDPTRDTHRTTSLDELTNSPLNDSMSDDSVCSETCDSEGDDNGDDSLSSYEDLEDSGDNDIPYVWPSDTYRYEALAYSTHFKALAATVQDQRSASEDSTMTINFRTPRRIVMGQHRVSTLRILVRLMREVHKDIFDGGPVIFREKDFWSNLWFSLDKTWGIVLPELLKERFDWVLEYIRVGTMPKEVLCFKDALRQVWSGARAVLRSAEHPYNYDVGCAIGNFFNPDLCPRWVNAIMALDDAMSKVLTRLSEFYGVQITSKKIQESYGILIADLWEEAYAQGWLDNNGTSDGESQKAFQHSLINNDGTSITTTILNAQPDLTNMAEQGDETVSVVKQMISRSFASGNASTWAWLHLRQGHLLKKGGNSTLFEDIVAVDPQFPHKERRIQSELREELDIHDYVEDDEFQWHGRLIPPGVFDPSGQGRLFRPGHPYWSWNVGRTPQLKDEAECFIFFEKNGIYFRGRDKRLLLHLPSSKLHSQRLELFNHERQLQSRIAAKGTSTSAAPNEVASETRKRHIEVEDAVLQEPQTKRIKASPNQTSQSDQPPRRNDGSQERHIPTNSHKWTTEQCEWVLDAAPDGKVDFDDVARHFEARFGFHRSAVAIRTFTQKKLGWRASTDTWTIHQRRWIVRAAKEGTLWCHMVQPFNDKFKAARTSDELKSQYEEILRYSDPTIPDEDKPEWSKHSEFEKFRIMISGMRGNRVNVGSGPWTQEQDDVLHERRAEEVPWKDISAEIEQKFGICRTTKALQVRLDSIRKQHVEDMNLRSKVSWTEEQMNWLRNKADGKKKIDWNDMAVQFNTRFDSHRNSNSIRSKWVRMSTGKIVSGSGGAVGQEEAINKLQSARESKVV